MEFGFRVPIGISLCLPASLRTLTTYRSLVLLLTFLSYTSYHLSRRPFSIVKNVLNRNCTQLDPHRYDNSTTWCDWAPFDEENANTMLATLDSCFLITYAIGMFISGFIADRCNLRYFLSMGMLLSGLFTYALGLAYYYNIHSLYFFVIFQILSGFFQTSGWPAVVACVSHWFSKSSRGLIFGLWNSHTNVGNILGAVIAGAFVEQNWGLSFIVPGVIMGLIGFLMFLFLTPYPEEVGISSDDIHKKSDDGRTGYAAVATDSQSTSDSMTSNRDDSANTQFRRKMRYMVDDSVQNNSNEEESPLLRSIDNPINTSISNKNAISFLSALKIPGVIEFSICLFFAKFVSYTFLYWLPRIIKDTTNSSSANSAYLSVPFDLGGMIGGVFAGYVVDRTGASAITCIIMLLLAIPSLYLYLLYGAMSNISNIVLQVIAGTFVNGPYALITTAVSAELGTKVKSSQALATVTAIIDGTGSLGAAIGPFIAGLVSGSGWTNVFIMVMISDALALISLLRISKQEYIRIRNRKVATVAV